MYFNWKYLNWFLFAVSFCLIAFKATIPRIGWTDSIPGISWWWVFTPIMIVVAIRLLKLLIWLFK
jgi:hypothetical protein